MRVGVRDCALELRNLEIAQVYCTISRSHNYSAQSRDSENAQRNLEIAQIPRLRGTYILSGNDTVQHINKASENTKLQ